jgi:phenylacetate-CoA ligase
MDNHDTIGEPDTARDFYNALLQTERYAPVQLRGFQANVMADLMAFVVENVPFYKERLAGLMSPRGLVELERWREIPILTQAEVREHYAELRPPAVPEQHGSILRFTSSGSGGRSIPYYRTSLADVAQTAAQHRHFRDFKIDTSLDLAKIRAFDLALARFRAQPDNPRKTSWTADWFGDGDGGSVRNLSVFMPPAKQLDWLRGLGNVYLNTFPSNAYALARHLAQHGGERPQIKAVISVGEPLGDHVRDAVLEHFGCPMIDIYSSAECGILACECHDSGMLHLQSELAYFEILDSEDHPAAPGSWGRLVVTPLYNFAMPLVRYETGDFVRLRQSCSCGRPHPTIDRTVGRPSNLLQMPNGDFFRPPIDREEISGQIGGARWQLVQNGSSFTLRYMPTTSMLKPPAKEIISLLRKALGGEAEIRLLAVPALGLSSSGKFLDVVNESASVRS